MKSIYNITDSQSKKGWDISMWMIYILAGFLICHAIISTAMTLIVFREVSDEIKSKKSVFFNLVFSFNVQLVSFFIYILIVLFGAFIWTFNPY